MLLSTPQRGKKQKLRGAGGAWWQICNQQCPGVCKPNFTCPQQPQPSPAAVLEEKVQNEHAAGHGLNSLLITKAVFLRAPDFLPSLALSRRVVEGQDFEQGRAVNPQE